MLTNYVVFRRVKSEVHVVWLDNFSKFYAMAVQGLSGAVTECLWTAHGLHRCVGPAVSTAVGNLRGMPLFLFTPGIIGMFKQKMAVADAVPCAFMKDSQSFKMRVRQVPLKPEVDPAVQPALAAVFARVARRSPQLLPVGHDVGEHQLQSGHVARPKDLFGERPKPGHFSFLSVTATFS